MVTESNLRRLGAEMLILLRRRDAVLDVFLLPHAEIKAIKAKFIKKKTEPNVLAFPEPRHFPHPERAKKYLGEVYLNKDILRKNPERSAPLLLHGILHLLGYDHIKKSQRTAMETLEEKILRLLER